MRIVPRHLSRLAAVAALSLMCVAGAAVLPDDRADLFLSQYKGGGMDITGESVLVRKKFSEQFAVEANYFVDKVSGASVDVLSNASVIKDKRNQKSLSLDYIHDKPVMLGTMRTGPDLANIGYLSDVAHQHKHLYNPRYKLADSIMPAFRFLYEWADEDEVRAEEKSLAEELTALASEKDLAKNKGKKIVPSNDARALVAYLLSLKRDIALPAPAPKPETP